MGAVLEELDVPVGTEQDELEELYCLLKRDYVQNVVKADKDIKNEEAATKFREEGKLVVAEFSTVVNTLTKYRRLVCPDCNAEREQPTPQLANPKKCRCKTCEDTRFIQNMFVCENNSLSETEKNECKCLKCTCDTTEKENSVMDRLQELYEKDADDRQHGHFVQYVQCVRTQMGQLNSLDARKQKMMKEDAFYRSYAILKYAILNKFRRSTILQIRVKIDEMFGDDKKTSEFEQKRTEKNKTYKKFGIFPIKTEELEEHLTNARVLWLKKFLSKTEARGAPRQPCPKCNNTGTQPNGKKCPPVTCTKENLAENFEGSWPNTNDVKYNIDYEPTLQELEALALELSITCKTCEELQNEKRSHSLEADILEHRKHFSPAKGICENLGELERNRNELGNRHDALLKKIQSLQALQNPLQQEAQAIKNGLTHLGWRYPHHGMDYESEEAAAGTPGNEKAEGEQPRDARDASMVTGRRLADAA